MLAVVLMAQAVLAGAPPATTSPPAAGETPPAGLVIHPDWVRKPTGMDIARVYPREAASKDIAAATAISCAVTQEGTLSACQVFREEPAGLGFGEAALKLARLFKMGPMDREGQPTAGRTVRIPIGFRTR
jgi:protein TonB